MRIGRLRERRRKQNAESSGSQSAKCALQYKISEMNTNILIQHILINKIIFSGRSLLQQNHFKQTMKYAIHCRVHFEP